MVNVKIDPAFDDSHMDGEYQDERYQEAEERLIQAVVTFVKAGGRSDNLEEAVANALSERLEVG